MDSLPATMKQVSLATMRLVFRRTRGHGLSWL